MALITTKGFDVRGLPPDGVPGVTDWSRDSEVTNSGFTNQACIIETSPTAEDDRTENEQETDNEESRLCSHPRCDCSLQTLGVAAFFSLATPVLISMVAVGSIYKDQCPAKHYIPIFLIVAAAICAIHTIWLGMSHYSDKVEFCNTFEVILSLAGVVWFLAGNVWVYSIYTTVDTRTTKSNRYCHPTCYYFAFWLLNGCYILFAIGLIVGLLAYCISKNRK